MHDNRDINKTDSKTGILILFFTAYTMAAFFKISANIVIPVFQERFAISSSFAGFISGLYYLPYAFLQLFAAPLSKKYSAQRVVATGFILACIGSLLFAFAFNAYMVMAGRFLVGVGVGPVFISILQYLTENFKDRQFALYTGLAVTFSGMGQAIASAPLKICIEMFGIPAVFTGLSILMIIVSISLFLTSGSGNSFENNKINVFKQIGTTACAVIKSPVLVFVTLSWVFYNSIQHSYQGLWSAKWMVAAFPDNASLSGLSATLVSLGLMTGTFFSERLKPETMTRLTSTVKSEYMFAVFAILVPITHQRDLMLSLLVDFALGFYIGDICIQQTAYVREFSDDSISSSITGFMNFCSSLSTLFFQWATGLSADKFVQSGLTLEKSYFNTFLIFAGLNLLITVLCSVFQEKNQVIECK